MEELFKEIEKWSQEYDISFQFWGQGNNNVYIMRDDIDLYDTGGCETIKEVLEAALKWIYRVNRTPRKNRVFQN